MNTFKKIIYNIARLVFPWESLHFVFLYLKIPIFTFFKLVFVPKQRWSKREIWKQLIFQNFIRNPLYFTQLFKHTLMVCITYRCNISCNHCYARGLREEIPKDMTVEDFSRLVSWAKDKGWRTIRFLGGEPTIHPEFTEMLEICYRNKMFVNMSTNNLFSSPVLSKLESFWHRGISINCNAKEILGDAKKALFEENLKQLRARNITFGFSYTVDYQDENLKELFYDIKLYRPEYVRTSLAMPDFSSQASDPGFFNYKKCLVSNIIRIQEECIRSGIPFYNYRPIPLCIFSQEEWLQLKGIFTFAAFTRCSIGYQDDYAFMLTVNPDLTIFPCSPIFVKGPNILNFKDREQISIFFKKSLEQLFCATVMESCKNCPAHEAFISSLKNKDLQSSSKFFNDKICQGGCLNFKWHNQFVCLE